MTIKHLITGFWQKIRHWQSKTKPLHVLYLAVLLALGLGQGIISIIVLLLGPDAPVGSR